MGTTMKHLSTGLSLTSFLLTLTPSLCWNRAVSSRIRRPLPPILCTCLHYVDAQGQGDCRMGSDGNHWCYWSTTVSVQISRQDSEEGRCHLRPASCQEESTRRI